MVETELREDMATPEAAQTLHGLARLRFAESLPDLEARRVLEARPSGTLGPRTHGVVCRALKDTGTITAFALWNDSGM